MIPIESFIRADVKVRREGRPALDFGAYRFRILPRVGELIHVHMGETPHCLRVDAVEHFAYTEDNTPTPWDTVIKLTCEAVD
jgi:hypothetical protein